MLWAFVSMLPSFSAAQISPIELGVDASLTMSIYGGTTSVLSVPERSLRAGFFVSEYVSIEHRVSIQRIQVEGVDPHSRLSLQLSGVFHVSPTRDRVRAYVIPTLGLRSHLLGDRSSSQVELGCGVGAKIPIANYLSARFEAGYLYGSENEELDRSDLLVVKAGLSLFTR